MGLFVQLHTRISQNLNQALQSLKAQWDKIQRPYRLLMKIRVPVNAKNFIAEIVLDNSNDAILVMRQSGQIIYSNKNANRLFEKNSKSTLTNQSITEVFSGFSEVECNKLNEAILLIRANQTLELVGKDTFGRPRIYLIEICAIKKTNRPTLISLTIKDISQNEVLRYENDFLKTHDITTGTYNREAFLDKLQRSMGRAERYNTNCAVMFFGLDGFAAINQAYGHKFGDMILKEVAKRIQSVIRDTDVVARFGGDEFLVLLDRLDNPHEAGKIADYIIRSIHQPFQQDFEMDFINLSAGIAIYPQDEEDPTLLIQCARMGLLEAKQKGKSGYQYYQDKMQEVAQRKIIVANELRKALRTNQLEVYFQPLLQTKTLKVLGVEALARWHHPQLGYMSPQEFVCIAEEMGFIAILGRYIFTLACQHFSHWTNDKKIHADFKLAINLSVKEFLKEDFVDFINQTVKKYNICPSTIQLEITESIFIKDTDLIIKKLNELKSNKFEIVMDDFGTGYSCLSILSDLPIDAIKIDKSFSEKLCSPNPSHQAIVRAIVELSKNLQIKTIAEGIETVAQQSYMTKLGVDGLQGFLFAKPMNPKDTHAYIQNFSLLDKRAIE